MGNRTFPLIPPYGKECTLITDHKPLEIIYGTPTSKPSARIEHWVLRLQPYRFFVHYKAGADNPADYLSRHPVPSNNPSHIAAETEEFIHFVTKYAAPKAMTINFFQQSKIYKKQQCNTNTVTFVARKDTRSPGLHYKCHLRFSTKYQR